MRKKSLATRLFGYLSLMLCVLVVIIGSFYWVQSSELFHREVEEHTIHEIDTSAKYIEQYVSNLKSTSIALAQLKEIQTYAQNDHANDHARSSAHPPRRTTPALEFHERFLQRGKTLHGAFGSQLPSKRSHRIAAVG